MSLSNGKSVFKDKIKKLVEEISKETDSEKATDMYVEGMADIIVNLIKSGEVNFASNTVTGLTPTTGGALVGGAATGGKIT